ncbi:two-component system, NtrC family, response regulator HydG [Zhouia amylolytica]|uniref:Two-component system, NtrC family, response regulator HydG n=1 Tax=Zhouia amylolytica TaxID=376730 RepID=A0A1I6SJM6_9FLAO|nr:sigma-54 dependent transcriptional regulator [Zhouia amylolytica]SFS77139.1 two-component system, NtrC family, response regulator HydG [Zhouia amylolytica]
MISILLVEDDVSFSVMLERFLKKKNYQVQIAHSLEKAYGMLKRAKFDLIFTDLRLPDGNGLELLEKVREDIPSLPIIMMTGYAEVPSAVKAMKLGAFDYISKPFNQEEVLNVINNAVNSGGQSFAHPKVKNKPDEEIVEKSSFVEGVSAASKKLNEFVSLVAPTDMSVLITGESGTGKEVVAKSIHNYSHRKNEPFIAVDCGAIPKEIAASEFFGHVKGSFTGAVTDKSGHFEAANGGTLFLDEVGNLSYENQVQLLRALQERKIKPIGSNKEIEVDIRLITATNEDLQEAVDRGDFREDLYHRLNEFSISVPRLSDRTEDLPIFADFFLERSNEQLNKKIIGFTDETIEMFQDYRWPGNLREFSNVIKRAVLLAQNDFITPEVLPSVFTQIEPKEVRFSTKEHEKELIIRALKEAANNKTQAAKLLKITRKTLYNKLKEYDIH